MSPPEPEPPAESASEADEEPQAVRLVASTAPSTPATTADRTFTSTTSFRECARYRRSSTYRCDGMPHQLRYIDFRAARTSGVPLYQVFSVSTVTRRRSVPPSRLRDFGRRPRYGSRRWLCSGRPTGTRRRLPGPPRVRRHSSIEDRFAQRHDHDVVGECPDEVQVVLDDQHGHVLECVQHLRQVRPLTVAEPGRGFVEEQQRRASGQAAGEFDHALVRQGQLAGRAAAR